MEELVAFPGLGLSFNVSKVAFSIFGLSIYKYAVCIVIGIVVSLILARISKEKFESNFQDVLVCTILGIIFGTIGARIYYILFNLDFYMTYPDQILNLRNGGLAIYGGLFLGGLSILIYCKIRKIKTLDFFDYIVPFVALGQCFGRWGNFFNVEAYGIGTNSLLRMEINIGNKLMSVHPTFLYESLALLVIFVLLRIVQKHRKYSGEVLLDYCLLYAIIRFFIEGIRADSLMIGTYRVSQIVSLVIVIVIAIILNIRQRKLVEKVTENNN